MSGQVLPDATGQRAGVRRGVFTFVVSRQKDAGWLAVAAHNTDIVPGVQTHLADDQGGLQTMRYSPRES